MNRQGRLERLEKFVLDAAAFIRHCDENERSGDLDWILEDLEELIHEYNGEKGMLYVDGWHDKKL